MDINTAIRMLLLFDDFGAGGTPPPPGTGFLVYETLDNIIDNNGFPILYTT